MEKPEKTVSLHRQCQNLREALHAIFRASRYLGPRPDDVLRAMVRCNLVEYRGADGLLRGDIEQASGFKSQAQDRETCWKESESEKRRMIKIHHEFRVKEIKLGAGTIKKSGMKSDRQVVEAITAELENLRQPLPPEER